ncbi:hypothetical protein MMC21_003192 [Puttea exsequens]|nr:hypothetical protein [Puttea exsequens]
MANNIIPRPPYKHHELRDDKSLRLLKLRHADDPNSGIICDLLEVPPDQKIQKYEALSWTWDSDGLSKTIVIDQEDKAYNLKIPNNLYQALKVLREKHESRTLWVDAICINQQDLHEKNHQIPMMPSIYGDADRVCVWLGDASEDSDLAIDFMKEIMDDIWKFDELCKPKLKDGRETGLYWKALFSLIMRPWFSRRWIVQEIALAKDGLIYCGPKTISWRKFSDAVSLFVEVETATHRLSEIMKRSEITDHIPNFFDHVAHLSATLLIDTTNFLFRRLPNGEKDDLLSLEYLVSKLSIFKTSNSPDAVYSLLAISKNTLPTATPRGDRMLEDTSAQRRAKKLGRDLSSRPFPVDYGQDYVDTCKDFVQFSIRQAEGSRALDIICRPWAPPGERKGAVKPQKLPSWIRGVEDAAFEVQDATLGEKINRINANPLVGLPFGHRSYGAAGTRRFDIKTLKFLKRPRHYNMFVKGFVLHRVGELQERSQFGNLPKKWFDAGGWTDLRQDPPEDLWRTLVANRGPDGRNPLSFYPTALRVSTHKGWKGTELDTHDLINHGRCSIVAQFLRRVQEVVWNRKLMHTYDEPGQPVRLGLVHQNAQEGDSICILYGCTVPIILRKVQKSADQIKAEELLIRTEAAVKIQRQFRSSKRHRKQKRKMLAEQKSQKDHWLLYRELLHDSISRTPKLVRRCIRRGFKVYNILALSGLIVLGALCIGIDVRMSLPKMFLSVYFGLVVVLALFPRRVLWRIWSELVINWLRLRPSKKPRDELVSLSYYRFIGECYLHGMMDSEAITYQNDNNIKAETFELH